MLNYNVHYNGARPFTISVDKGHIYIYDKNDILLFTIKKFQHIFIGDNIKNKTPETVGNSIIIKMDKYVYIYIGQQIYKFESKDEILDYKSPIGNNDVPYPYAIGETYTYLLAEKVYIKNSELSKEDPYKQYYSNEDMFHKLKTITLYKYNY